MPSIARARRLTRALLVQGTAVAMLATGCSPGGGHPPGGTTTTTETVPTDLRCSASVAHPRRAAATSSPGHACWFPTGVQGVSPSIQVTEDGVLFVARETGGVLRSRDGGRHWSDVPVPGVANGDGHAGSAHGYVHVDPRTDRVYYVTSLFKPSCGGLAGSVLSWSDDLGETWEGTTVACDTYDWGKVVTGPAPEGNAYPSAIYFMGVGVRLVGGQRYVYRSLDGGATWERMDRIASATTEAGVGVAAPDGTVYFDYPEYLGFDPGRVDDPTYPWDPANECRQMVAVSEDHGETWRQEPVPGSQACGLLYGQQRVAVDSAGTVYVVWVDDTDTRLYMSTSRDRARTWSEPVDITAPGMTFALAHANVVAGEPGHVVVASLQTDVAERPAGVPGFRGLYGGAGYTGHAVLTESRHADRARPRFRSADLDADGDATLEDGQSSNEANAYLAMSPDGQAWAVYSRHSASFMGPGDLVAARFLED